jgi:hypothetical protein
VTRGANLRVTWEFSRGFSRRVTRRVNLQVTGRMTRGVTCRMPILGAVRLLSGALRRVPAQALREAGTAVRLRFVMPEAMHASIQLPGSRVIPVATNVAVAGDLSKALEETL